MASVQCFKNAEKTYYQQSPHGNRMEHAISHSQTECYGQSEKHLPLGQGYMAHGNGHGYMAHGNGNGHGYMAHGNGNGHGYTGHGHGHMAQAHRHHSEHAMAKTQTPCMGQNNGHHLGQHAQTHCITQAYSHKKESSCHGKSKKKGEYKKEKIIVKKKFKECKSGDSSSSSSESESDNDRC